MERQRELAIRLALGATPAGAAALIVRQGSWLITVGLLLGVGASLAVGRLTATLLFGVQRVRPADLFVRLFRGVAYRVGSQLPPGARAQPGRSDSLLKANDRRRGWSTASHDPMAARAWPTAIGGRPVPIRPFAPRAKVSRARPPVKRRARDKDRLRARPRAAEAAKSASPSRRKSARRRRCAGCSRRTRTRSTRFSSRAASRSASGSCPNKRAPARPNSSTPRAAAARAATSRCSIRAPASRSKFTYAQQGNDPENHADPREAAEARAGGRHRPRADLQDVQGRAHLQDERRGHRLGPQPERLPARRRPAERLRVHFVERRGAAVDDDGWAAEDGVRESERAEQSGHDSRAQDDRRRSRRRTFDDMFFDDIKTLYDLDAPETGAVKVEQTYSDYRKGDSASSTRSAICR